MLNLFSFRFTNEKLLNFKLRLIMKNTIIFSYLLLLGIGFLVISSCQYEKIELVEFDTGEHISFFCPLCHAKLKSDAHENLASVQMTGRSDQVFNVYFSEIAGEKSTFVLVGDNVDIYGKDAKQYINFFNLAQNF